MLLPTITLVATVLSHLPSALALPPTIKVIEKPTSNLGERALAPRITCPAGQYLKGKNCAPCTTDFGTGATSCTTAGATACASPFFLLRAQNGIYMDNGGVARCVAECPAGGFPKGRACVACSRVDVNALTCTASEPLTCKPRTVLKNGKCTGSCGDGFFLPRGSRTCGPCNGPGRDKRALTCDADFVFTCTEGYVGLGNQCGCAIQKFIHPDTNLCVEPDAVLARVADFTATINGEPDAQTSGPAVATSHGCYDFCAANTGPLLFTIQLDQPDTCLCGSNLLINPPPQPLAGSQTYSATVDCAYIKSKGGWAMPEAICEDVALVGPYCFVKNLGANTVASTQKVCRLYVK